jgi:hypothetical protein
VSGPDILGRQPETLWITPSRPNPWYGSIVEGQRFTMQQVQALRSLGTDPETAEAVTVTRNATTREMYWPKSSEPPCYQFECPVLARRRGRISIISPSGITVTIDADCFVGRAPATKGKWR